MKKKRYKGWMLAAVLLTVVLNLVSLIPGFSDWYAVYIFPFFNNMIGRVTGLFPFSLGEVLIAAGILFVMVVLVSSVLLLIFRKSQRYQRYIRCLYKVTAAAAVCFCLLDTLTFHILHHCSKMRVKGGERESQYSVGELADLHKYLTARCNELGARLERDDAGKLVCSGDYQVEAREAMHKLARRYSRLEGYYPKAKPVLGSVFMSYTNTAGVFFNLSMEANYNRELSVSQLPQVICHEYAHFKGYIYEDEAEFIGYLACLESDDPLVRYSGYLSMWEYVDAACAENMTGGAYQSCSRPSELVRADMVWLEDSGSEPEQEEAWLRTALDEHRDTIGAVSNQMTDMELKLYGVSDGIASYSRVVELLLQYYDE